MKHVWPQVVFSSSGDFVKGRFIFSIWGGLNHAFISYKFLGDAAAAGSNIGSKKQEPERTCERKVCDSQCQDTDRRVSSVQFGRWAADPVGNISRVRIHESSFTFFWSPPSR